MAELTPAKNQKIFTSISELHNYADNRNLELELPNFDHKSAYSLEHRDGSKFFVTNVHMELVRLKTKSFDETFFVIFSEHHQPLVYSESDLKQEPKKIKLDKK